MKRKMKFPTDVADIRIEEKGGIREYFSDSKKLIITCSLMNAVCKKLSLEEWVKFLDSEVNDADLQKLLNSDLREKEDESLADLVHVLLLLHCLNKHGRILEKFELESTEEILNVANYLEFMLITESFRKNGCKC